MPPSIADLQKLAGRNDKYLDKTIDRHQRRLLQSLGRLEDKLVNLASRVESKGDRGPKWTLSQTNEYNREMVNAFAGEFDPAVQRNLAEYADIATEVVDGLGSVEINAAFTTADTALVEKLKKQDFKVQKDLATDAQNRIAQVAFDAHVVGVPMAQMVREIKGAVNGQKDVRGRPLSQYAKTYAQDAVMNVHRVETEQVAERAGLDHYLYSGTVIKSTRPWCASRLREANADTTHTRESMDKLNADSWSGKRGHPMTYAGGWGCRHHWLPVDPEWLDD